MAESVTVRAIAPTLFRLQFIFLSSPFPTPGGDFFGEGTLAKLQKAAFRLDGRCFMNFLLFPFILSNVYYVLRNDYGETLKISPPVIMISSPRYQLKKKKQTNK